jgi:hypothetical protein
MRCARAQGQKHSYNRSCRVNGQVIFPDVGVSLRHRRHARILGLANLVTRTRTEDHARFLRLLFVADSPVEAVKVTEGVNLLQNLTLVNDDWVAERVECDPDGIVTYFAPGLPAQRRFEVQIAGRRTRKFDSVEGRRQLTGCRELARLVPGGGDDQHTAGLRRGGERSPSTGLSLGPRRWRCVGAPRGSGSRRSSPHSWCRS